ncbi:MAG: LCP family protein [Candidatus Limnocylindrales bacterium]
MSFVRSPALAAFLSFMVPGLGQFSLGSARRGVLIAIPAVGVFLTAVGLGMAGGGALLEILLRPEILVGALVLNVVLTGYHVTAVIDAYRLATRGRPIQAHPDRLPILVLAAVLVGTVSLHGAIEAIGYEAYETMEHVFVPAGPGGNWSIPEPSVEPEPTAIASYGPATTPSSTPSPVVTASPVGTAQPSPSASPTPSAPPRWAKDGRLDLLLIGSDAGPDRWSLRTDTIVVLSVDVESGRVASFGIPRNLVGVPLPPESADAFRNGRFPGLLNALYVYAMGHPRQFPGGDARGFRAVTGAVQELVGVRLDAVVVVNLAGFVRLVDAIGGLWIDVPERLVDRNYPLEDGSGHIRLDIKRGCQLLDGRMALAYARSRHQDSDYGRMRRQQAVLVALALQVDPVALLPKVPTLLKIASDDLWTTVPRSEVRALAELAARADTGRVKTVRFVPSHYPSHLDTAEIARIRRVVRSVFDGRAPDPAKNPAPSTCP